MCFLVRSVKHFWSVVGILLLGDADIDTDVEVAECVVLELELEFLSFSDSLRGGQMKRRDKLLAFDIGRNQVRSNEIY